MIDVYTLLKITRNQLVNTMLQGVHSSATLRAQWI